MNIDVFIEPIQNGFIIEDNDSMKGRNYYATLEEFVMCRLLENIRSKDIEIRESVFNGESIKFVLKTGL